MRRSRRTLVVTAIAVAVLLSVPIRAQQPTFVNGLAQPVFSTTGLITQHVWVEVPDLDTDRDGINDRIRIQIRRPVTSPGVKLPIVMTASPYSGGQLPFPQHDITGPLYEPAVVDENGLDQRVPPDPIPTPPATNPPYNGITSPIPVLPASTYQSYFLPRGFIFVEAQNLGTGMSTGCPTIGGVEESLAMKAVIDWFNGVGNGFDSNNQPVSATSWTSGKTTMIGVSYDGTLPIAAASTGVAGLKAIVPIAGVSSYYDHRRSFGVPPGTHNQVEQHDAYVRREQQIAPDRRAHHDRVHGAVAIGEQRREQQRIVAPARHQLFAEKASVAQACDVVAVGGRELALAQIVAALVDDEDAPVAIATLGLVDPVLQRRQTADQQACRGLVAERFDIDADALHLVEAIPRDSRGRRQHQQHRRPERQKDAQEERSHAGSLTLTSVPRCWRSARSRHRGCCGSPAVHSRRARACAAGC